MEYSNSVSIIMPVYNEELYIDRCMKSLLKQNYKHIEKIMIIDGMSTDKTRDIIKSYESKYSNIILMDNHKKIQSEALNLGIQSAASEIIIRVDAHAVYDENYVRLCVEKLNELKPENVANVGGPTYLQTTGDLIGDSIIYLHESKFGIGVAKFRDKNYEGFVDTVWNGAFWRWVFDEVGLYNVKLLRSEDNDMNERISQKGYKIFQCKSIIAYYYPRTTVKKILQQNYSNGKEIGKSIITNPKIIRLRHIVPLGFVASTVIFGILAFINFYCAFIEALIFSLYFLVDILASLKIGKKHEFKFSPIMFLLFYLLHLAYGIGTFGGLITSMFVSHRISNN